MKKQQLLPLFIVMAFISSLCFAVIGTQSPPLTTTIDQMPNTALNAKILGDEEDSFTTPFDFYDLTYLDGTLWAASIYYEKLFGFNPVTGTNIQNTTLPFTAAGLTTDGTYLYASVYPMGTPNGTIAKMYPNGTIVSVISIPLTSQFFPGLAWDGSSLWASHVLKTNLYQINPSTGTIVKNLTVNHYVRGLTWVGEHLWGVEYPNDRVCMYDTTTGQILENFHSPFLEDNGLAYNGTHFIENQYMNSPNDISFLDLPTEAGEVYRQFSVMANPTDITWNGTHYMYGDSFSAYVESRRLGVYTLSNVHVWQFIPVGMTTVGSSLYVSQHNAPYNIYQCTWGGTILNNFTGLDFEIESLAYDGTYLWAQGTDNHTYKLDPADCSLIANYSLGDLAGITYDWRNKVLWAISPVEDTVKQIDPSTGAFNGEELALPVSYTERGLTFDGTHLIVAGFGAATVWKIIIDFPSGGGIPGFADTFLYLSVIFLVGLVFFMKRNTLIQRK
jgi:hypothetical protein